MEKFEDGFKVVDLTGYGQDKQEKQPEKELIKELSIEEKPDKTLAENKSVDVYNALNLFNEQLGELYETEGYNPFEKDFKLTEEYTAEILEDKKMQGELSSEEFLENNNKIIAKKFANALEKNNQLINKVKHELENITDEKVKAKMNKMLVTLKNRSELLRLNIQKLKSKDANAIKMYKDLFGLDSELSKILKEEFEKKVNNQNMVIRMIELCNNRAKQKPKQPVKQKKQEQSSSYSHSSSYTQENTATNQQTNQDDISIQPPHHEHHGPHHHDPHLHGPHHNHDHEHRQQKHRDHEHEHKKGHKLPKRPKREHDIDGPEIDM